MNDDETLQGLRRELAASGPDQIWLNVVTRVVRETTRARRDKVDEIVQDLFLHRLLQQGNAVYIATNATDLRHAKNLIRMHLRQMLSDQSESNAARRVTDRVIRLLEARFPTFGNKTTSGFGDPNLARKLKPHDIDRAARAVLTWRRLPDRGEQRASRVFDTPVLETHLEEILPILGDNFYISDIYEIFYSAFTVLGLRAFEKGEDLDQLESDHKVLGSEEALILEETVRQLDGALTDEHRLVFALWMTDMTQDGRAKELGVSKPTLLSRQKDARAAAAPILRDVPPHIGELALREIISRCF